MFKLLPILCLVISSAISGCSKKSTSTYVQPPPPPPPQEKPYSLAWSDEFNTDGVPDSTKWTYETGGNGWGNNELEFYTNRPENARVSGGNLIIEARKEAYVGKNYTSARLISRDKAKWTYGRFDIRAKLPSGKGTWPAIWLLSNTNPLHWPDDGEIDIMEEVGFNPNVIYGTAHSKLYNGSNGKGGNVKINTAQDSFHVYSVEWAPGSLKWSVDSASTYYEYYDPSLGVGAWPYSHDFFMILNIAVGGNWGGAQGVDDSIFPQQMLIDYVRIYQRK